MFIIGCIVDNLSNAYTKITAYTCGNVASAWRAKSKLAKHTFSRYRKDDARIHWQVKYWILAMLWRGVIRLVLVLMLIGEYDANSGISSTDNARTIRFSSIQAQYSVIEILIMQAILSIRVETMSHSLFTCPLYPPTFNLEKMTPHPHCIEKCRYCSKHRSSFACYFQMPQAKLPSGSGQSWTKVQSHTWCLRRPRNHRFHVFRYIQVHCCRMAIPIERS